VSEAGFAPFPIVLDSPEQMNLLGLLMKGLLEENLSRPGRLAGVRKLRGDVLVQAGQMSVTLRFGDDGLLVVAGRVGRPRATVRGGMTALLGVVTRQGGLVRPVLAGRVKVSGNLLLLLRMLPLIRVAGPRRERSEKRP